MWVGEVVLLSLGEMSLMSDIWSRRSNSYSRDGLALKFQVSPSMLNTEC